MKASVLDYWFDSKEMITISDAINSDHCYRTAVYGLDSSARTFFMAGLVKYCSRPTLVLVRDSARVEKVYSDLKDLLPPGQVHILPAKEQLISHNVLSLRDEYRSLRLKFLDWLSNANQGIYIASLQAVISKMIPPSLWFESQVAIRIGQQYDQQQILEQLVAVGYERVSLTEDKGYFSVRGNIVDIYPPGHDYPVRVEFHDVTVSSVRLFDPGTQRSTEKLTEIVIPPARELFLSPERYEQGRSRIVQTQEQTIANFRKHGEFKKASRIQETVEQHLDRLAKPDGLELYSTYFSYFYGEGAALFDYLTSNILVFIEEASAVYDVESILQREMEENISSLIIHGHLLTPKYDPVWKLETLISRLPGPLINCSYLPDSKMTGENIFSFNSIRIPCYYKQWAMFDRDLQDWFKNGYRVCLMADSINRGQRLLEILYEQSSLKNDGDRLGTAAVEIPSIELHVGDLEEGFIFQNLKLVIITEHNILPKATKKRRITAAGQTKPPDYRKLSPGDYVVHEQHGIGVYNGLKTLQIEGVNKEYLVIRYKGADKLYIPVDQAGLIDKYSSGEGPAPRLHSLGGGEWKRIKSRVKQSVQELAGELLTLYAARKAVDGYNFGPDHPWQQEFEAYFPYEETPDQLQAVAEVKADLEKKYPMDRLICGDVGYGKTEVALRAAFKVVLEGKQVAVLVPTTVLAQQHYRTFRERFARFPVKVAQLSRFVSAADQKEILKEISSGKIDIVIGTHRLLSKDVHFSDLGLMIIDEEQRFGVRQKEKMKRMRLAVDILTMSATPIPRTLHLSMAGARDLSIMETPPENRYPIQTYIMEYTDNLVREVIQREINRQGQVFFVYNRVDRIDAVAAKIKRMFPEASVAVGHGQLPEAELEQIMTDFQDGKFQILVSTTIIESGLDMPNVNTLIIYDADRFGLAQLYQIRGRVGRSNRIAYAYLTYRQNKVISETAKKRLGAIREFTELGSGFKIALRDLEIRGAGNILGAEQHGFIVAVGFDLYCRLLEQAVEELKSKKSYQKTDPQLEIIIDAFIPASYIPVQDQKIGIYQRIFGADMIETIEQIKEELVDRYGPAPKPVINLLTVAELRVLAAKLGIELIQQLGKVIILHFSEDQTPKEELINKVVAIRPGYSKISETEPFKLLFEIPDKNDQWLPEITGLMKELVTLQTTRTDGCEDYKLL